MRQNFLVAPWCSGYHYSVYSKPYKHICFWHLVFKTLFTSVSIVSYKRLCHLYKEVGLVLVSCNPASITLTSSLLYNLVIGLFKIFSILVSELVWILANCTAQLHSTKPELRFCASSNPVLGVSEIRDDEDLWQWSPLKIRLNTTKANHHHHHHHHHHADFFFLFLRDFLTSTKIIPTWSFTLLFGRFWCSWWDNLANYFVSFFFVFTLLES